MRVFGARGLWCLGGSSGGSQCFPLPEDRFPKLVRSLQSQGSILVLLEFLWQHRPGPLTWLRLIGPGEWFSLWVWEVRFKSQKEITQISLLGRSYCRTTRSESLKGRGTEILGADLSLSRKNTVRDVGVCEVWWCFKERLVKPAGSSNTIWLSIKTVTQNFHGSYWVFIVALTLNNTLIIHEILLK